MRIWVDPCRTVPQVMGIDAGRSTTGKTKELSSMKNVFVGNMNYQTTESDLRAMFAPFGQITRVHLAMDRETGRPRGFAFVEMADDEGAAKAISALNGTEVAGRALKVNEVT